MPALAEQIEAYLLAQGDWVPDREICAMFDITARQLRRVGKHPGLCTKFAISGDNGHKHVSLATTGEWLRFKHRLRRHGIMELVTVRNLGQVRRDVTRTVRARAWEKDTGQAVMAM